MLHGWQEGTLSVVFKCGEQEVRCELNRHSTVCNGMLQHRAAPDWFGADKVWLSKEDQRNMYGAVQRPRMSAMRPVLCNWCCALAYEMCGRPLPVVGPVEGHDEGKIRNSVS